MSTEFGQVQSYYKEYFSGEQDICYNNRQRYEILFSLIEALELPREIRVLDVGAGSGRISRFLDEMFSDVISFDIAASQLFKKTTTDTAIDGVQAALPHLPFAENSFDLVVCSEVLEHLPETNMQAQSLNALSKVLDDDGWAIFTTPNPRSPTYKIRELRETIAQMLQRADDNVGQIVENWIDPTLLQSMLSEKFEIKRMRGSYYALPPFAPNLNKILIPISDIITERDLLPNYGLYQYYVVQPV